MAFPEWHGKTVALEWALSRLFCEFYRGQDVERVAAEWKQAAEEHMQRDIAVIESRGRDEAHKNDMVATAIRISSEISMLIEGLEVDLAVQRDTVP